MSNNQIKKVDLLIAGQGAAGFSAGLYAARYQMNTVIIGEEFGGETAIAGLTTDAAYFCSIKDSTTVSLHNNYAMKGLGLHPHQAFLQFEIHQIYPAIFHYAFSSIPT